MKGYSFFAAAALFIAISCFSAGAADGTDAMPFVRVNHDPISLGMGGAGIVNPSAYSSFSNTAALVFWDKKFDVGANYQRWSGGETQNANLGVGMHFGNFGISVGAYYGAEGEQTKIDENGYSGGSYRPYNLQLNVGVAWKFVSFLSVGLDIKYLNHTVDNFTSNSVAFDALLMTKLSDFKIAAGVSSIGVKVKDTYGNQTTLPTSVTLAGGYDHKFGKHGLNVALDMDYYVHHDNGFGFNLGAEYSYNSMVFVRTGYHYADVETVIPSYYSAGVGFSIIGIRIDFAYQVATDKKSNLKDTITVGLGFSF